MKSIRTILAAAAAISSVAAFSSSPSAVTSLSGGMGAASLPLTRLSMAKDSEDFLRFDKASRSASTDDRKVELRRPLGIVLDQDEEGNVYVATVAPRGNAARSGQVKEGDIVTMCSATFGDQMWSTRKAGLSRVLSAIRVRAGPTVSLVFERTGEKQLKGAAVNRAAQVAKEARERSQAKRDELLTEMDNDEKRVKKGKFLGLF